MEKYLSPKQFHLKKPWQRVNIKTKIPVRIQRHGKVWVAFCDVIPAGTQGHTRAEAIRNIEEAVKIHIKYNRRGGEEK